MQYLKVWYKTEMCHSQKLKCQSVLYCLVKEWLTVGNEWQCRNDWQYKKLLTILVLSFLPASVWKSFGFITNFLVPSHCFLSAVWLCSTFPFPRNIHHNVARWTGKLSPPPPFADSFQFLSYLLVLSVKTSLSWGQGMWFRAWSSIFGHLQIQRSSEK